MLLVAGHHLLHSPSLQERPSVKAGELAPGFCVLEGETHLRELEPPYTWCLAFPCYHSGYKQLKMKLDALRCLCMRRSSPCSGYAGLQFQVSGLTGAVWKQGLHLQKPCPAGCGPRVLRFSTASWKGRLTKPELDWNVSGPTFHPGPASCRTAFLGEAMPLPCFRN